MSTDAITRIHDSGTQGVIAVTGGGAGVIGRLLAVPGASRFLLEARVPYCTAALDDFLGAKPEQYCSDRTARAMAMAAYWRATKLVGVAPIIDAPRSADTVPTADAALTADVALVGDAVRLIGLGASASLASDRPKRGRHRVHAAIQTATHTARVSLTLVSGRRTRAEEESLAADLLLALLEDATSDSMESAEPGVVIESANPVIRSNLPPTLARWQAILPTDEGLESEIARAPDAWSKLLLGQTACVECQPSLPPHAIPTRDRPAAAGAAVAAAAVAGAAAASGRVLFPGAFHPLHDGHRAMARVASEHLGRPVEFELSIENVDKPPLDFLEIAARTRQFTHTGALWLTRAPTFLAKARLFPKAVFVVGADTVIRIAVAKYYATTAARDAAIEEIQRLGCRFLVFGRVSSGQFRSLADLDLPPNLAALCDEIPESNFRLDISSTEIRRSLAGDSDRSTTEAADRR